MSTVYGIIKQTGGFIYPESVVGKGPTFRIFLPRHVPSEGEVSPKLVVAPVKDLTGNERILLVEDEESCPGILPPAPSRSPAIRSMRRVPARRHSKFSTKSTMRWI